MWRGSTSAMSAWSALMFSFASLLPAATASLVFTDSHSKKLLRLDDDADGSLHVLAHNVSAYGGLKPWKKGMMLAATKSHTIVQINPWCNSSECKTTPIVNVPEAIGAEKVVDNFALGGITLCGDNALFVAYGGNATAGHSGVLRCERCELDTEPSRLFYASFVAFAGMERG